MSLPSFLRMGAGVAVAAVITRRVRSTEYSVHRHDCCWLRPRRRRGCPTPPWRSRSCQQLVEDVVVGRSDDAVLASFASISINRHGCRQDSKVFPANKVFQPRCGHCRCCPAEQTYFVCNATNVFILYFVCSQMKLWLACRINEGRSNKWRTECANKMLLSNLKGVKHSETPNAQKTTIVVIILLRVTRSLKELRIDVRNVSLNEKISTRDKPKRIVRKGREGY